MSYTKFDQNACKALRKDLQTLFEKYGIEGLNATIGNMRFSASDVEVKIKFVIDGAQSREESLAESQARILGLETQRGNRRLVEYKSRNHKYPWIYEEGGKRYKCSTEMAKIFFRKEA